MGRFERRGQHSYSARDAVGAVALVAVLLVLFAGGSIRDAAAQIDGGIGRDVVEAIGGPTEWIADRLPLDEAQHELTAALSPDQELGDGGFDDAQPAAGGGTGAGEAPSTAELETLLVTGDSLSTPLDTELARRLAPEGVEVVREPHLGTGISNTALADWGELSTAQVAAERPDAVVVFIGANEGYGMPGPGGGEVECCGPGYAAVYANRVRQVMDNYRQDGAAKVYWLTVMTPRDPDAARVSKLVNESIRVAAQPWASQVRVVDTVPVFTPGERYTDSIPVDGTDTIVRESDGIHLNGEGSSIAADLVLERIDEDFER
jgi:hypothetical protein